MLKRVISNPFTAFIKILNVPSLADFISAGNLELMQLLAVIYNDISSADRIFLVKKSVTLTLLLVNVVISLKRYGARIPAFQVLAKFWQGTDITKEQVERFSDFVRDMYSGEKSCIDFVSSRLEEILKSVMNEASDCKPQA